MSLEEALDNLEENPFVHDNLETCEVANFNEKAAKKILGMPRNVRIVAIPR